MFYSKFVNKVPCSKTLQALMVISVKLKPLPPAVLLVKKTKRKTLQSFPLSVREGRLISPQQFQCNIIYSGKVKTVGLNYHGTTKGKTDEIFLLRMWNSTIIQPIYLMFYLIMENDLNYLLLPCFVPLFGASRPHCM